MIQDIYPHQFQNAFTPRPPQDGDYLLVIADKQVYLTGTEAEPVFPQLGIHCAASGDLLYLFTVDDAAFYLADLSGVSGSPLLGHDLSVFRTFSPQWLAFAGITGCQLYRWYHSRRFCGCCGTPMAHSETERAMGCPDCGLTEYPKISPAVIVGIIDGDRLLLTKYAGRTYTRYALVAGFLEIGETFEGTVHREVLEEVGIRVKNVRYYKSQPWAFTDCLLAGFFCDLDGDDTITLDTNELAVGEWVHRSDIPPRPGDISLTSEMIEAFRLGEV